MPIQVNEVVIRAIIDTEQENESQPVQHEELDLEALIAECVEQVLDILQTEKER